MSLKLSILSPADIEFQEVLWVDLSFPVLLPLLSLPGAGFPDVGVINPRPDLIHLQGNRGYKKHDISPFKSF